MSIELDAYNFLREQVEAILDESSPLYQLEVLKDEYEEIKKERGLRIGRCTARIAPNRGQTAVKHFDALLTIIFYIRIRRGEKQERSSYREQSISMAEAAAMLFYNDPEMGGRSENSRPLRIPRGMDDTDNNAYAISNLVVVVNETGQINFDKPA